MNIHKITYNLPNCYWWRF